MASKRPDVKTAIVYYKGADAEYIRMPELDYNGALYPDCRINEHEFLANKTYAVHPDVAAELERIIDAHDAMMRRMNSSRPRNEALRVLDGKSAGRAALAADVVSEN
jgi:hypothetical protein